MSHRLLFYCYFSGLLSQSPTVGGIAWKMYCITHTLLCWWCNAFSQHRNPLIKTLLHGLSDQQSKKRRTQGNAGRSGCGTGLSSFPLNTAGPELNTVLRSTVLQGIQHRGNVSQPEPVVSLLSLESAREMGTEWEYWAGFSLRVPRAKSKPNPCQEINR